ncbi:hypothetical protein J2X97_003131 [Epilithonimonas hungarica]|uniref:hypothetical protein n=1 Tax=Epilithonimonas hungarica TaxID=454006 RepID=UPI002780F3D8|nr:hypothetical protein [Epilithonimonas hungarica]MDP9957462.1 hypothetical protein [Epilithonimonas hungarica]
MSTRKSDIVIDWGDGTIELYTVNKNVVGENMSSIRHNYNTRYTGDVKIYPLGGLNDVYAIGFTDNAVPFYEGANGAPKCTQYRFSNEFIKQFSNIIYFYAYLYYFLYDGYAGVEMSGDWADIPDSLETLILPLINTASIPYINCDNFSTNSNLKNLLISYDINYNTGGSRIYRFNIKGDLAKLPPKIEQVRLWHSRDTTPIYSGGRNWNANMDSVYLFGQAPISGGVTTKSLTQTDNDRLLNDLSSVTSWSGDKKVHTRGTRSSVSNDAVTILESKGVTVTPSAAS